jgi:hypothetical protein
MKHTLARAMPLSASLFVLACSGSGSGTQDAASSSNCTSSTPAEGSEAPDVCLAFAQDFRGYHGWASFDTSEDADLVGIHDGSLITEYIKRIPESGSTEFSVGTLIVKEATGGTIPHEIFGMSKRGGGYNPDTPGWEWFELENLDGADDSVKVIWRGFGPPLGETYGGDRNAGCNTCHTDCGNDGVCAKALQLTDF